jgi:hypothetical protein
MASSRDVLSKAQNHALWQSGAYGNRLRSWRSLEGWLTSGYGGLVALRVLGGKGGRGPCHYDLTPLEAVKLLEHWIFIGVPSELITIDEAAPRKSAVLQGEYLNDVVVDGDGTCRWGLLHYSRARVQMRDALGAAPEEASGLRADLLLREAMSPASHDDWRLLLERYPGHVLEVSVYERCLGDCPGRNALVWEVRKY